MIVLPQPKDWDKIDPESLLELVGVRRMSREFGFLFRHYWVPGTTLTYHRRSVFDPGADPGETFEEIIRRPGRCTADMFCWRETTTRTDYPSEEPDETSGEGTADGFARILPGKVCVYNRSNQTFRTRHVTDEKDLPASEADARIQALLHIPILTPLLPVPLGFRWHVEAEDGYMEYELESATTVGDMPVLFVRRRGEFSFGTRCKTRWEGVTAYAPDRSTVLEDRACERVEGRASESRHVVKLVRSTLEHPDMKQD